MSEHTRPLDATGLTDPVHRSIDANLGPLTEEREFPADDNPAPPAGVGRSEGRAEEPAGPAELTEVMPEIQSLAQKVGGLKRLGRIIDDMSRDEG